MRCADVRERLLEADAAKLRGETTTDLTAHLATCATCREAAGRILAAEDALRAHLAAVTPARPAADVLPLARARVRHHRRLTRLAAAVPALAAAGVAIALFTGRGGEPPAPTLATVAPAPVPLVDATPGQRVAVFKTDDPNIVIVWTF